MKYAVVVAMVVLFAPEVFAGDEEYKLGPDSMRHEGVPKGTVTKSVWHSKVFPDTVRDYYLYVPAQYNEKTPACVMVFQDGHAYVSETGEFRVPVVFDNLIHKGEMPVTIGIFIDPGHLGSDSPGNRWQASNRSFEYDSLSDQYGNWWLANQEIVAALKFRGYDYKFIGGAGTHGGKHGGAILPDSLRWLWHEREPKLNPK